MNIKTLEIKEISLVQFSPKNQQMTIEVQFTNETPLTLNMTLERDTNNMVNKIITQIKKEKKPKSNAFSDDFLAGVSVLQIVNDEEELIEWTNKGFARIQQNVWNFKRTQEASTYMRQLERMTTMKEVLYSKKR